MISINKFKKIFKMNILTSIIWLKTKRIIKMPELTSIKVWRDFKIALTLICKGLRTTTLIQEWIFWLKVQSIMTWTIQIKFMSSIDNFNKQKSYNQTSRKWERFKLINKMKICKSKVLKKILKMKIFSTTNTGI